MFTNIFSLCQCFHSHRCKWVIIWKLSLESIKSSLIWAIFRAYNKFMINSINLLFFRKVKINSFFCDNIFFRINLIYIKFNSAYSNWTRIISVVICVCCHLFYYQQITNNIYSNFYLNIRIKIYILLYSNEYII